MVEFKAFAHWGQCVGGKKIQKKKKSCNNKYFSINLKNLMENQHYSP